MANERLSNPFLTEVISITIANGASLSAAVDLYGCIPTMIELPASLEGTAITFQGGSTSTTADLYDEAGTEVNFPAASSRTITITNVAVFYGVRWLKVRTGTAASATNQTGDAVIKITVMGA